MCLGIFSFPDFSANFLKHLSWLFDVYWCQSRLTIDKYVFETKTYMHTISYRSRTYIKKCLRKKKLRYPLCFISLFAVITLREKKVAALNPMKLYTYKNCLLSATYKKKKTPQWARQSFQTFDTHAVFCTTWSIRLHILIRLKASTRKHSRRFDTRLKPFQYFRTVKRGKKIYHIISVDNHNKILIAFLKRSVYVYICTYNDKIFYNIFSLPFIQKLIAFDDH